MIRVVVDPAALTHILNKSQLVELCDASGQVIGHFIPVGGTSILPTISDPELDRRQQARGGRPLADILADLEKQT